MSTRFVLIDTNIWHFALVKPIEEEYIIIHEKALEFLSRIIDDKTVRIGMSTYQVAEIIEVLRRSRVPNQVIKDILDDFKTTKFYIAPLMREHVIKSISLSLESGIHIYDYLVSIPLENIVDEIFSADKHFKHKHFTNIAKVTNPLEPWTVTEGRMPTRME